MRFRLAAFTAALVLLGFVAPPAQAATPDSPVLVAPANGSTATSMAVPLSVTASDPDGDALDVRFEGRVAGATVPGGGTGDPFTVVVLPDTQNYTYNNRQSTMSGQTQWIVNTQSELNTAMVIQLGDLVSEYVNTTQWGLTSTAFKILDDAQVPNTVLPGNHDFNNTTGEFAQYDTYFPPSRYAGTSWVPSTASYGGYLGQNLFGTDPVDRRNMDNFALFTAAGRDFLVLNLEWEAPQYALDWGAKVLAAYPDRTAILATHSFVGISGQRSTVPERPGGNPPSVLWSDFVYQQCSVRLVVSGHYHNGDLGEANRSDLNRCGDPVQQVLTDYQDRANGGDGWLRYYTFDPAAGTMKATTYSSKLDQYETDADSSFTVPFDLSEPQAAPFTTIATEHIASGGTATTTWADLDPDTTYEWRVVASDGTTSSTSQTWTVRTPQSSDLVDDTFSRNVSNGWGAADADHTWVTKSTATAYSVDGGAGRITAAVGATRGASLTGLSQADVAITTDLSLAQAASGSGTYVSVLGRLSGTNSYRAKLRYLATGGITLSLIRYTGAESTLATATVAGVSATPGLALRLRFELEGTSLRAKVWPVSGTEPAAWTVTATDSTSALQVAGSAGMDVYTSSSAAAASAVVVDRFTVSRTGTTPPPVNQAPTAAIGTPDITDLTVTLSGTGSNDPDGTITNYAWNYGDNTTGTGATTTHTYATAGTYTITLTVTDNNNATNTTTRQVSVTTPPPVNQAPTAAIGTPDITDLTVTLSGTGSNDPDGTITNYAWNYGDNTTGTGATTTHTYATAGTCTITLTVTDNNNATNTTTRQVSVTTPPPVNQAPTAAIGTPDITDLTVTLSGTGSNDPDGTITNYAWNYGDNTTGTGATTTHTYATAGTYTITLTVTDNNNATNTTTRQVSVTTPPPATGPLAGDAFGRSVTNGWGTADTGGAWSVTGSTSRYAVSGGTGRQILSSPGTTSYAALTSVSSSSTLLRTTFAWNRTAATGTLYASFVPRRVDGSNDYRCKVVASASGAIQLHLVRRVGAAETTMAWTTVSGLTMAADQAYAIACQAVPSGASTRVTGKVWRADASEPASWQVTATDGTAALQGGGSVGVSAYISSSSTVGATLSVDDLLATDPNA